MKASAVDAGTADPGEELGQLRALAPRPDASAAPTDDQGRNRHGARTLRQCSHSRGADRRISSWAGGMTFARGGVKRQTRAGQSP
jgi:hypothetical protein